MNTLVRLLMAICLLRRGPSDLPYSIALTRGLVVISVLVDLFYVTAIQIEQALPRILFSLVLLIAVPWLLLAGRGLRARYVQTLGALAGTGALFTLFFLPVALWAQQHMAGVAPGDELSGPQMAAGWLVLGLLGWRLAVNAHILRLALDAPRAAGILLALAWFLLEFSVDRMLFGAAA